MTRSRLRGRALLKNGVLLLGKLPVAKDHERRTPAEFQETGAPPQDQGDCREAPRPPLGDSLGACALSAGLEFQEDGGGTGPFGEGSEPCGGVVLEQGGKEGIKLHRGPLPPVIVVDETWVKVGGKEAWIYVALDPRTLKVVYLGGLP